MGGKWPQALRPRSGAQGRPRYERGPTATRVARSHARRLGFPMQSKRCCVQVYAWAVILPVHRRTIRLRPCTVGDGLSRGAHTNRSMAVVGCAARGGVSLRQSKWFSSVAWWPWARFLSARVWPPDDPGACASISFGWLRLRCLNDCAARGPALGHMLCDSDRDMGSSHCAGRDCCERLWSSATFSTPPCWRDVMAAARGCAVAIH